MAPAGDDMDVYFRGERLYGDDFDPVRIAEWYSDEKEGYAALGAGDVGHYRYGYHAWNVLHGYRHLAPHPLPRVLGYGSAYGDELLPIIDRIGHITVVDPSDAFVRKEVHGVPAEYVKPSPDGNLPFDEGTFDLITCLGVLHHVPNVTHVVSELARVLRPGGRILLREPIVSMGDWRKPRFGLTKRERGIPLAILENCCHSAGLVTDRKSLCAFPVIPRVFRALQGGVYNNALVTRLDAWLSRIFAWNINYHPANVFRKIRPTSVFLVLGKHATPGDVVHAEGPSIAGGGDASGCLIQTRMDLLVLGDHVVERVGGGGE